MTGQITAATRTAMKVAAAAMEGNASAYGPADTIVLALDAAGLLQSPETAAELDRLTREREALNGVLAGGDEERGLLRARLDELAPYEALHPQECEHGQHAPWFVDTDRPLACPWCRIAELEETGPVVYRAENSGITLGTYASADAAGAHAEAALRDLAPGAVPEWRASESRTDVIELHDSRGPYTATGYAVVTVPVAAEYDPEADA